jgi:hypothetical protein
MRKEYDRYIVDDVILIAGKSESEHLALRQSLRNQLANGKAKGPQAIVQASFSATDERKTSDRQVEHAIHEVPAKPDPLYPTASNPPRELPPDEPDDQPDPFADLIQTEP